MEPQYTTLLERKFKGTVTDRSKELKLKIKTQRNVKWSRHCALIKRLFFSNKSHYLVGPISHHSTRYNNGSGVFAFLPPTAVTPFKSLIKNEKKTALPHIWKLIQELHAANITQGNIEEENIVCGPRSSKDWIKDIKFINWSYGCIKINKSRNRWPNLELKKTKDLNDFATMFKEITDTSFVLK